MLLHGHAAAVLLLHVLAALEFRAECHLPLLRNGVAARHLVVVLTAAHLLLVLVATHARLFESGSWFLFVGWLLVGTFGSFFQVFMVISHPGSNDIVVGVSRIKRHSPGITRGQTTLKFGVFKNLRKI